MKRFLVLLTAVLLLTLLLLWPVLYDNPESGKPNTVSLIEDSLKIQKIESPKAKQVHVDSVIASQAEITQVSFLTKENDELTYMDVYRMKRLYWLCKDAIYAASQDENYNPVVRFETMAAHLIKDQPTWPTNKQVQAIQRHAIKCDALMSQVNAIDLPQLDQNNNGFSLYIDPQEKINRLLSLMQPDSIKAKNIADVLKLVDIWNQHYLKVLELSKGDETHNASEIEVIKAQIQALRNQQQELSEQINNDPEASSQYALTWQEINQLEGKVIELKLIDPEARNTAITTFEIFNSQLFEKLRSADPDVFFEAQMALEKNTHSGNIRFGYKPYKDIGKGQLKMPFIEYVSPGDVIKNIAGLNDNQLFGLVINYATQLYHCELGADCGPESQWIGNYCISVTSYMNPVSCDLDLPTFYQQHLLSENQWHDVQNTLAIIRGVYVQ